MGIIQTSLAVLALLIGMNVMAQDFKSFTYFENDSTQLELDLFLPKNRDTLKSPLVIYVHGGGFMAGNRKDGHRLAKYLAERNIACATLSYTLSMEGKGFGCKENLAEKIKAIQIAANQVWESTAFLLSKSVELNIDPSKVFIAGSSAGAETVLHAAFWDREQMHLYGIILDNEFKYAGVIAGAGAIMDLNLINKTNAIPLMAFHGDEDLLVPYKVASHHYCPPNSNGWLMLFGSRAIADHLQHLGESTALTTFQGGGHSYAGAYFYEDQKIVGNFINMVLSKERFNIHKIIPSKE